MKNIWFVLGTAGELIKIYPVIKELESQGSQWSLIHTGQSGLNFWRQWDRFGLAATHLIKLFPEDRDLQTTSRARKWFLSCLWQSKHQILTSNVEVLPKSKDSFVVHGDTLSTLIGAVVCWRFGGELFHVEAGLRSEDVFEPFPEEILRRMTSVFAHVHFPPDDHGAKNLIDSGTSGEIIPTKGNTLLDAIRLVPDTEYIKQPTLVVANLHRHENLANETRWQFLMKTLEKVASEHRVVLALHPPAKRKLEDDFDSKQRLLDAGVELRERMPFAEFASLLKQCEFVVTDGGSNQEECHYLGKPCLILRETTERLEGLGANALLSKLDENKIDQFLSSYEDYKREPSFSELSPSKIIVDRLLKNQL